MKYLLPLLFLVGCESFPEKKEPQLIEEIPLRETWIDEYIDDSFKEPIDAHVRIGAFGFYLEPPILEQIRIGDFGFYLNPTILEIDLASITGRRFMLYIGVKGG